MNRLPDDDLQPMSDAEREAWPLCMKVHLRLVKAGLRVNEAILALANPRLSGVGRGIAERKKQTWTKRVIRNARRCAAAPEPRIAAEGRRILDKMSDERADDHN
jgi:hypothetical protein